MNLNDVFCQINANSCNLAHGTSPFKGCRLTSKPILAQDAVTRKWEVPSYSPTLSRPAGRERELTALFGRVSKQRKYTTHGALRQTNQIFFIFNVPIERVLLLFQHAAKCGCWLLFLARRGEREAGVREWGQNENEYKLFNNYNAVRCQSRCRTGMRALEV